MNDLIKSLAPTIASALMGPLAGVAVSALGNLLGVSEPTQEKIADAITGGKMTPDQISRLKELELQFKNDEAERGFKYADLEFRDRDSARQMQSATNSLTPAVLTYMITTGFFGVLGLMLYDENVINSPPLLIMLGSLGTAWTGACAFWFGTTSGSQEKSKLLLQSAPPK